MSRPSDGENVCTTCGSLVSNHLAHDLFHNRLNLMYDAIPVSMIETSGHPITATDWQAAHDAGEDEELRVPPIVAQVCGLCGHEQRNFNRSLGGSVTEPGQPTVHLCHGCDEGHDCYHRWTVYRVRPHTDDCRDLYCGGCEEVDAPHEDPCDCDDCRIEVGSMPRMLCAMCGTEVHKRSGSSWRCDNCRMWRDAIPAPQPTLESQPDTPTEPIVMHNYEPPVGSVARCTGCGNVYVHRPDGWLATDGPVLVDSWGNLARSFCGPVKVIYNPEKDK